MAQQRHLDELLAGLSDYLEGSLPSEVEAQIQEHLGGCPHCAQFGEQFAQMLVQAQAAGPPPKRTSQERTALLESLQAHLPQS